jgi:hypothetical protein
VCAAGANEHHSPHRVTVVTDRQNNERTMSEELETFLGGLNLSEFVQECVVQRVTTVKTLALLSEKNMIELGMKIGDRIAIKEALENRLDSDDLVSVCRFELPVSMGLFLQLKCFRFFDCRSKKLLPCGS